jgi:tRNA nucleotidyltransferase/poly(A) polymerase
MNYSDQIQISHFSKQAISLCQRLHDHRFQAYIVGGALRDVLLDRPLGDIDIATDAHPDDISRLFSHVIPTGKAFGTMTVIIKTGTCTESYQVTTFRVDANYSDCRHPNTVTFSDSVHDDLIRRDFTINAFAWNPITAAFIDNFNGQQDLQLMQLQTVGEPTDRFSEDSLRLLRLCRFQAQLQFSIEEKTYRAAKALGPSLPLPSFERIYEELWKLIGAPNAWEGVMTLFDIGLFFRLVPPIKQPVYPTLWSEWTNAQRMAFLIKDIDQYETHLKRLRFPKKRVSQITRLIQNDLNADHADFKVTDLDISGEELIEYGIKGSLISQVLNQLRQLVLDQKIENTNQVIKRWLSCYHNDQR